MNDLAHQFLLDPSVTFLNHGSYGACPAEVFATWQGLQREMEAEPVAYLDPGRGQWARLARVRDGLAAELGASASDLALMTNATEALNVVAHSLPLGPGDEILTTDHEYSALDKTWAYVARARGARVVVAEVPLPLTDAGAMEEALLARMGPQTRVLFLSHIASATALVFPVARLVAAARARGIFTVIDGAHGPGQVALNLDEIGADAYAGNGHKWMLAPKGTAFLHVRPEAQEMMAPRIISHGWQEAQTGLGPFGGPAFSDRLQMLGTRDPSAWLAWPAATEFRARLGWDRVSAAASDMAWEFGQLVAAWTGLPLLASRAFSAPQMVALPLPPCDPVALKAWLWDRRIEAPCYLWQGRPFVRVAVQGYNSAEDLETMFAALKRFFG